MDQLEVSELFSKLPARELRCIEIGSVRICLELDSIDEEEGEGIIWGHVQPCEVLHGRKYGRVASQLVVGQVAAEKDKNKRESC